MTTPAPAFRRGAAANDAATASSGGNFTPFQRTEYFNIKPGEKAIIRFLTDYDAVSDPKTGDLVGGWLGVKQHQNIKTRPQPEGWKGSSFPQRMGAPCRRDPIFATVYNDCYICDVMKPNDPMIKAPSFRLFALAVMREEVVIDGKRTIRDQTRKVTRKDASGAEVEVDEKRIVVLNMGKKNFFDPVAAWASRFGTVLDRDYEITRQGEGLETTYLIIPEMEQQQETKADGTVENFDLREDEFMARYLPTALEHGYAKASDLMLEPLITEKTTDEFYGKFFNPAWSPSAPVAAEAAPVAPAAVEAYPEAAPAAPAPAPAAPSGDAGNDIAAMIERLQTT